MIKETPFLFVYMNAMSQIANLEKEKRNFNF